MCAKSVSILNTVNESGKISAIPDFCYTGKTGQLTVFI